MVGSNVKVGVNPFVGPRPLETGQRIFRRNREIDELYYLMSAERIVLLHSPSGAKSSLIRAGLIPRLAQRFDVRGPTRVNTEPSDGMGANRYIRSASLGFEEGLPEDRRRSEDFVSRMTLAEYVETRPRRRSTPENVVLIFDQFEEILTADPLAIDSKREFFRQLGELLQNPKVWALFVLREDYLAPLDPYANLVPTHLKNRYRIDLLSRQSAQEAMVGTAADGGRIFAPEAATKLVYDLATMKVQQPDGRFKPQVGPYVEPLHLQVACRVLWERMPTDELSIDLEDLKAFGDVTRALSGYYDGVVGAVPTAERAIREWVGEKLITKDKTRSQVRKGAGESEGLSNELVAQLVTAHLVRPEPRAGAIWYELAHDRLIEAVSNSNEEWFSRLSPLQKSAALWERTDGRPSRLLVTGAELKAAVRWASQQESLTRGEQEFLAASRKAQKALEEERRVARKLRIRAIVSTVVGVIALGAFITALWFYFEASARREEADKNARRAAANEATAQKALRDNRQITRQLASSLDDLSLSQKKTEDANKALIKASTDLRQSLTNEKQASEESKRQLYIGTWQAAVRQAAADLPVHIDDDRSILLAMQARLFHERAGPNQPRDLIESALQQSESQQLVHSLHGHTGAVRSVSFARDGNSLASGSDDGTVRVWNPRQYGTPPIILDAKAGQVRSVAFAPDGNHVASASEDGLIRVWDLAQPATPVERKGVSGPVMSVTYSPDGNRLAAVYYTGSILIWDPRLPAADPAVQTVTVDKRIYFAAFSPDANRLAIACDDGVRVIKLQKPPERPVQEFFFNRHTSYVNSVAFAPGGRYLASASYDRTVRVWDLANPNANPVLFRGHSDEIRSAVIAPEGSRLASAGQDGIIRLWDLSRPSQPPTVLDGRPGQNFYSLAFSPNGDWLASGSDDNAVRVSELRRPSTPIDLGSPFRLLGTTPSLAGNGHRVANVSANRDIRVWDIQQGGSPLLTVHPSLIFKFDLNLDGNRLAVIADDRTLVAWDVRQPATPINLSGPSGSFLYAKLDPEGNRVATAGRDTAVRLWDLQQPTADPIVFNGHKDRVDALAFAPNGNRLASASSSELRIWDVLKPNATPASSSGQWGTVSALAFAPEGDRLVSGHSNSTLFLWDLRQPTPTSIRLNGHPSFVEAVSFEPGGNRLAAASRDGTVLLFDLRRTNAPPVVMAQRINNLASVAFTPDGSQLVAIDGNNDVHKWRLWTAAAQDLCTRVWRNLSMDEWKFFIGEVPYERTCSNLPPGDGAPSAVK